MSILSDLQTARAQIATQIKDITLSPKPTYSIDGQTVKWTEHLKELRAALRALDEDIQNEEGPFEETTRVIA